MFAPLEKLLLAFILMANCADAVAISAIDANYSPVDDERGSWIALAIITTSVLTAFLLNHTTPAIRTMGTFLASLGCFGVVVWFAIISGMGVFEHPRPPVLPVDEAKPLVLSFFSATAFFFGVMLLVVTYWQSKRQDQLCLTWSNEEARFGKASRYLHWITAILFLLLIPLGIFTTLIPEGTWYRKAYYVIHKSIGIVVFLLLFVRLFWHRVSSAPDLDGHLKRWERRMAKIGHFMLYALMLLFPITGFIMSVYLGHPSYFFTWELPLPWPADEDLVFFPGILHKVVLPYMFYLVFGAHLLGALKHRFIDRQKNSFRRIVS